MEEVISHISYNNDNSLYLVSTNFGYRIYSRHKNVPEKIKNIEGGVKMAYILDSTNIVMYVAENTPTNMTIWDTHSQTALKSFAYDDLIIGIRITRKKVAVIFRNKVLLLSFPDDIKQIAEFNTCNNDNNLCLLTDKYLVCLDEIEGRIRVVNLSNLESNIINAHTSAISCMNISPDQNQLVTTSIKGTIIRLFNISDGIIVKEFRRGLTYGNIYSCSFNNINNTATQLCVSSDTGTLHIYNLLDDDQNYKSYLASIKSILPQYCSSTWSSMNINDAEIKDKHICLYNNHISSNLIKLYVVSYRGIYSIYIIDDVNKVITKESTYKLEYEIKR